MQVQRSCKPPHIPHIGLTVLAMLLTVGHCKDDGNRPSVSKMLPVLDLLEPEGALYDPRPQDIDAQALRLILGASFDVNVMSEVEPKAYSLSPNGSVQLLLRRTQAGHLVPYGQLPRQIRKLHLQHVKLADGKRVNLKLGNKMKRRFRDLLWLHSHCPLLQRWRDLGTRFWPRWFLEGSCAPRPTCSFPRGMRCRPHRSANKVLLRWHCQDWTRRKDCRWLKVRYPLVTECRCGC